MDQVLAFIVLAALAVWALSVVVCLIREEGIFGPIKFLFWYLVSAGVFYLTGLVAIIILTVLWNGYLPPNLQ